MLGLHKAGDDGLGHLGFAVKASLMTFGSDVFNKKDK